MASIFAVCILRTSNTPEGKEYIPLIWRFPGHI
jgi:hypothetical protein